MFYRFKNILYAEGLKITQLWQKLGRFCRTRQIGCFLKTNISVLANQHTVHSGGVASGGSATLGATPPSLI